MSTGPTDKKSHEPLMCDRNFDDLAHRFQRNVYGGTKGEVRLKVLQQDFRDYLPEWTTLQPLSLFDAGGGLGQMSVEWAARGHQVTLCDISENMLAMARSELDNKNLLARVNIQHCSIQEITQSNHEHFDGVICHAVLEWAADPQLLLTQLSHTLKPGGFLSVTFYNVDGAIFKNLLRGNFKKIRKASYTGYRGSLTPQNPLKPAQVFDWYCQLPLDIVVRSGIRVFHDYIFDPQMRSAKADDIVEMELQHARLEPYWQMGRYIHVLARKRS